RLRDVDGEDEGVGVGAPKGVPVEHPRRVEVARVGELAGDLRDAVDTPDTLADTAELELANRGGGAHRQLTFPSANDSRSGFARPSTHTSSSAHSARTARIPPAHAVYRPTVPLYAKARWPDAHGSNRTAAAAACRATPISRRPRSRRGTSTTTPRPARRTGAAFH